MDKQIARNAKNGRIIIHKYGRIYMVKTEASRDEENRIQLPGHQDLTQLSKKVATTTIRRPQYFPFIHKSTIHNRCKNSFILKLFHTSRA